MSNKHIPIFEQETTVNILRSEEMMEIYTCDSTMITKLDKLVSSNCGYILKKQDSYGKCYLAPKKLITFRKPHKLSSTERLKRAERARDNLTGKEK